MLRSKRAAIALAAVVGLLPTMTAGGEHEIRESLKTFMKSADPQVRAQAVTSIESDAEYDRSRISTWLHAAGLFEQRPPGTCTVRVPVGDGTTLRTVVRIPRDYDAEKPYPLIYALHGMGGRAEDILRYVQSLLGEQAEQFIIAAPSAYAQVLLYAATPPSAEHMLALHAVRRLAHIDNDRVYVLGYSQGGHAAWTLAVTHPDHFAGVIPIAGTLVLQDYGRLFEVFLPNLTHTHVFACWGEEDVMSADYVSRSADGGIAGLNRQICKLAAENRWPITWYERAGQGHTGIVPPGEDVQRVLQQRRTHYPLQVQHTFRLAYQGQAYWLEMHRWVGAWWNEKPLKLSFRAEENPDHLGDIAQARARAIQMLLGELRGDVEGQQIEVYRKKVRELTVWLGDGMIDWEKPIQVEISGRMVFEGRIKPNLEVCLAQAARTYDFDRLRWAGIRYKTGGRAKIVTMDTEFCEPPITPP